LIDYHNLRRDIAHIVEQAYQIPMTHFCQSSGRCLVAIHHWDMVKSAIADHAWRFAALADEVS